MFFSKRALQTLIENVLETQDDHNDRLEIEGIVVNQFQSQSKITSGSGSAVKR